MSINVIVFLTLTSPDSAHACLVQKNAVTYLRWCNGSLRRIRMTFTIIFFYGLRCPSSFKSLYCPAWPNKKRFFVVCDPLHLRRWVTSICNSLSIRVWVHRRIVLPGNIPIHFTTSLPNNTYIRVCEHQMMSTRFMRCSLPSPIDVLASVPHVVTNNNRHNRKNTHYTLR